MDLLTGAGLDRLEPDRGRADALPPGARVIAVHEGRVLLPAAPGAADPAVGDGGGAGGLLTETLAAVRDRDPEAEVVLLGERNGVRWAARAVPSGQGDGEAERLGGRWAGLRTVAGELAAWEAGLVAYAASLLAWHAGARHCGRCGAGTRLEASGHRRVCGSAECGALLFPRTDPAIITLVRRGEEALLVHQPPWPAGRLSSLAGFVEPGESLEEAVAREVAEETGLRVVGLEYLASQPWPFPHTLMVAFRSEAAPGPVVLDDELDDARWFTREGLRAAMDDGSVTIPPPVSLSRLLIEDWLGEAT